MSVTPKMNQDGYVGEWLALPWALVGAVSTDGLVRLNHNQAATLETGPPTEAWSTESQKRRVLCGTLRLPV